MTTRADLVREEKSAIGADADTRALGHPWVLSHHQVRFGIGGGPFAWDWPELRDFVQMVEELGFDSFWRPDHPVFGPDGWITLAGVAASTRRVRLGTTVSCVAYRNPVLLARIVADVDRISGGRVVLGLGAGNLESEFRALGLAFPPLRERQAALAEMLQVMPALLRGGTVSHHGSHFRVDDVTLQPGPVQQPYVPVLVAGVGERVTLRAVAQNADASNIIRTDATSVTRKYSVLREHCAALGRSYESILRIYQFVPVILADSIASVAAKRELIPPILRGLDPLSSGALIGTPEQAVERIQALVDAGCQYFILTVLDPDTLRLVAERVIPAVVAAKSA